MWNGQARLSLSPKWVGTGDLLGCKMKVCAPEELSPKKGHEGFGANKCVWSWLRVHCLLSSAVCPVLYEVLLTTL